MRLLTFLVFSLIMTSSFVAAQTLPEQPLSGPGGRNYLYDEIRVTDHSGKADGFWIFEPASSTKKGIPSFIRVIRNIFSLPVRIVLPSGRSMASIMR